MESFNEYMDEYKKHMKRGYIRKAYKGLMEYIMGLRIHFKNKYPEYSSPGSMYQGYMDMTYFPLFPKAGKLLFLVGEPGLYLANGFNGFSKGFAG